MKPLTKAIQDYLAMRRALGFKLRDAGMVLAKFAVFMEQRNAEVITTQLALEWAHQPNKAQPALWAQRLSYVRCFARHHIASDPKTEIPAPGLLPFRPQRANPYLYSYEEVQQLLEAGYFCPSPKKVKLGSQTSSGPAWIEAIWSFRDFRRTRRFSLKIGCQMLEPRKLPLVHEISFHSDAQLFLFGAWANIAMLSPRKYKLGWF